MTGAFTIDGKDPLVAAEERRDFRNYTLNPFEDNEPLECPLKAEGPCEACD